MPVFARPRQFANGFCHWRATGRRAGWLAAFLGFTLPSIIILLGFAATIPFLQGDIGQGLIRGLKLIAVAIVAHAVLGMAQSLANTLNKALIAAGTLALCLVLTGFTGQILAILLGALAGYFILNAPAQQAPDAAQPTRFAWRHGASLISFFAFLLVLPLFAATSNHPTVELIDIFYRAGALVFGGGHVVLPLLQADLVPQYLDQDLFLAGYGATQALPGPIFSFASYLGAMASDAPLAGVVIGTLAIFLPGFLLTYGALPIWHGLRRNQAARKALLGTNAAVVGLLAAALINPIAIQALTAPLDWAIASSALWFCGNSKHPHGCWCWVVALLAQSSPLLGFTDLRFTQVQIKRQP